LTDFKVFLQDNVIQKTSRDRSKANFLLEEALQSYQTLLELIESLPPKDSNANLFVRLCYDILLETIRAKMHLDGYHASGPRAHEAEVSYLKELGFSEKDVRIADKIRFFRNGMLYYGTILDKDYAEIVIEFTKINYQRLVAMGLDT
jgi:hypothetical protein